MNDPDDITHQQTLLASQRRTLGHLLRQRALHGAAHAPPATLNGIDEARAAIQRIKAYLRAHGVAVTDHVDDEEHADERGTAARIPTCPAPGARTLFGRDAIRDEIIAQLCGSAATVAISAVRGLPGVGKTDLVRAVGNDRRATAHFGGGVLYGELGPAPDLSLVLRRWLTELGVEPPPSDEPTTLAALLRQTLAPRRALLILDDVWDSSMLVASELRNCAGPACRVLASSRSPDVARAVSRGAEPLTLDVLDDDPALDLLRQHAPTVVAADESGARTLAEALGRLPLALKLAGTLLANDRRNRAPCATLLATWRARLDTLRGYETRPGRAPGDKEHAVPQFPSSVVPQFQSSAANDQLSLDAIIGMSYDALPGGDIRAAAAALAAFGATPLDWDWDAMAAVWGAVDPTQKRPGRLKRWLARITNTNLERPANELIAQEWERALVSSGMLEWDEATRRYSLHQTVHAFLERRADPAAYERHAAYYAALILQHGVETLGRFKGDIDAALAMLDQEIAQIERGHAWIIQAAPSPERDILLLRYAFACPIYFDLRGRYEQWINWSEAGRTVAQRLGRKRDVAAMLGTLGIVYRNQGRYYEATEYYQRSLVIFERIGDQTNTARALGNLGNVYQSQGRYDEATEHYQRSLVIEERIGDQVGTAAALGNLGVVYKNQGRYKEAIEHYQRSLVIEERIGNVAGAVYTCWNIGLLYEAQGMLAEALPLMEQAAEIAERISMPQAAAWRAKVEEVRARLAGQAG